MFDYRLGLALGKSLEEIRTLPAPEYRGWQQFYAIEPWGWQNDEYHFASILAILYNVNRDPKKKKAKPASDFMRNMIEGIEKAILQRKQEIDFENMSREEKRKLLIPIVKNLFGGSPPRIRK
jgi:hypothetical protein